jgi:hypothetical protein
MTKWKTNDLAGFGDAQEVHVAGMRRDGSLRAPVIVWVVRVGDDLYTRSVNGPDAAWFRGTRVQHRGKITAGSLTTDVDFVDAGGRVDEEIDAAYRAKYSSYPGPVRSITDALARSTTTKLVPHHLD